MDITQGNRNVFEDIGFAPEEATNLKVRTDLMLNLRRLIEKKGWTQAEAAERLDETQPRISNLMTGEIDRFSIDKLVNMLSRAGLRVRVEVESTAA